MKRTRISIAGGGPVSVLSALALAQHGHAVTLLEAEAKIDDTIINKKRLETRDPQARQAGFDELRATAEDLKKHGEFLLHTALIASVRKAQRMA